VARRSRNTRQKEIIEMEILRVNRLFSAEELYGILKTNGNEVGIATIYRLLNVLISEGKLHSFICERKRLYSIRESSHCHFTCQSCGKITHFEMDKIDSIRKKVDGQICHLQVEVSGFCRTCLQKKDH
jgi:Fur family transcriptional regulator, ferric uptake regulator